MASLIGRLVACHWLDAHGDAKAEMGPEEIALATSYGFIAYGILVRDDRGRQNINDPVVGIAHERGQDGRYRGISWIPAGMVKTIVDRGPEIIRHRSPRKAAPPATPPPKE